MGALGLARFRGVRDMRPVEGFPGYCVGPDGSVWSSRNGRAGEWKRMSARMDRALGYFRYGLTPTPVGVRGKPQALLAHRLVLAAFVGPCPEGMEGCHNNGDRTDNRAENLRWDTRTANMRDKYGHGTMPVGVNVPRSKVDDDIVRDIRERIAAGESSNSVARHYRLASGTVSFIKQRKTWKHVAPGPIESARTAS